MKKFRTAAAAMAVATAIACGSVVPASAAPSGAPRPMVVDCNKQQNLARVLRRAKPGAVIQVTGTCYGPFIMDKNLTIVGDGSTSNLSGNDVSSVALVGVAASVTFSNINIRDGYDCYGAGLRVLGGGTAQLVGNTMVFANNAHPGCSGGGIYNEGTVILSDNAQVTLNTASSGAGIFTTFGTVTMTGASVVINNEAEEVGGGLYLLSSTATISGNSLVSTNTGNSAGGIYNVNGTITMTDWGTVANNVGSIVGGVYNSNGSLTMGGNAVIAGNTGGTAGGVYNAPGTLTVLGSAQIFGNTPNDVLDVP